MTVLSAQPDMEVVTECATVEDAVRAYAVFGCDVVLMALRLHDLDAALAIGFLRAHNAAVRIVALTTAESDGDVRRLLELDLAGYVRKSDSAAHLLEIIRAVHRGVRSVPSELASRIAVTAGESLPTRRELQVVGLLSDGQRNKQIARELNISAATVAFHIKNVVGKLHADDRAQAVAIAMRRGLL